MVDLPFEKVVLEVELLFGALRIFKKHALDEDVDELDIEVRRVARFAPQKHSARREYAHVFKHFE